MATIQDTMAQRQTDAANKIGNLYNQQYASNAAQLKSAYDQNMAKAQQEQAKIAPQYQTQANQMATAYERNRRNAAMQAMNSGMNTGTAVQQQDALNRVYQQNYANLRGQEAQAQTEAGQKMVDLGVNYQNQLNQARAEAENKKASALVTEQNNLNSWYDTQAKQMAQYGDFSAYEKLYGPEAAAQMKNVWIAQNPEAALNAGMIDSTRYKQITGHAPGKM